MERRRAHLAGRWYPGDADSCAEVLESHAPEDSTEQGGYRGIVSPHAGLRFSGEAAVAAFAALRRARPDADLVVVFGNHLGPSAPHTLFRGDAWETPLGDLETDHALVDALSELSLVDEPVHPAHPDNGSELQMPLVRHFFPGARLVMLGAAARDDALVLGERVGASCAKIGRQAVFVGSTDLTHYGPGFRFEPAGSGATQWVLEDNDRRFIDCVLAGDETAVVDEAREHRNACCPGAVAAAMRAARVYGGAPLEPALFSHYSSARIHADDTFVSYAGMGF